MKIFIFLTAAVLFAGPVLAAQPAGKALTKTAGKKTARQAPAKPAPVVKVKAETEPAAAEKPETAPALPAEVPQVTAVAAATAVASADVKTEPARPQSCPNCFLPLLTGYKDIVDEFKAWTAEMAAQATDCDLALLNIQKQIDEKDDALAKARLGTDKKAVKAAVKGLTGERKRLLKEYSAASDKKADFYKQFSDEIEKKTESYNKLTLKKMKEAQAAASQEY